MFQCLRATVLVSGVRGSRARCQACVHRVLVKRRPSARAKTLPASPQGSAMSRTLIPQVVSPQRPSLLLRVPIGLTTGVASMVASGGGLRDLGFAMYAGPCGGLMPTRRHGSERHCCVGASSFGNRRSSQMVPSIALSVPVRFETACLRSSTCSRSVLANSNSLPLHQRHSAERRLWDKFRVASVWVSRGC